MKKAKKQIYKKWWFWLIIVLVLIGLGGKSNKDDLTDEDKVINSEANDYASDTETSVEASSETATIESDSIIIQLVAGEEGEYGDLLTLNKGTELEETQYVYHIPAGEYIVTNIGDNMGQINIYSDETHVTDEGWEEPAESFYIKLLDVGESDTFTIEDGQYIEIHEPDIFQLEMTEK